MRTEPPSPLASALSRLRSQAGRARRWLAARGVVTRVGLLVVALGTLGGVGYLASLPDPDELAWSWLFENRRLSSDDIGRISEALDVADIPHATDRAGRIGVKPARRAEALAALAKAKAVPLSFDELAGDSEAEPPWGLTFQERERRDNSRLEKLLKAEIEGLDPAILSAHVMIHRVKKRPGLGSPIEASSFVHLQVEGGRRLGPRIVEGIQRFLTGSVPELKPDAITAVDQFGYAYLAAGNPSVKEEVKSNALVEEWHDKILEELQHIPGVGVSVLLETVPAPPPPPEVPPPSPELARPNGKAIIEPDPPVVPAPSPSPASRTRANVWVKVPRSFYLLEFQSRSPGRQPTTEDLEPMRLTTEKLIHDAVEIHIPKEELGAVKIAVIQDDLASSRPLVLPSIPETHRAWTWVALSGGIALAGMVAVAALVRMATRRPSAQASRTSWRPGFVADGPSGPVPGPSEKVRELIRLNPEAAAGVLQRWIGQGGALE